MTKKKSTKKKTNYSWKTSLPAYFENAAGKDMQARLVLFVMKKHKGRCTLKEVQDYLRYNFKIILPQSTVSGRMNDLRDDGLVAFYGETRMYRNRIRKVFEIIKKGSKKKAIRGKKIVYEKVYPKWLRKYQGKHLLTLSNNKIWVSIDGITWKEKKAPVRRKKPLGHSLTKKKK